MITYTVYAPNTVIKYNKIEFELLSRELAAC